jgi:hypothetical protein
MQRVTIDELKEAIDDYCYSISADHHKNRDGEFYLNVSYNSFTGKGFSASVVHPGYCNEFEVELKDVFDWKEAMYFEVVKLIKEELRFCLEEIPARAGTEEETDYYCRPTEELLKLKEKYNV